MNVIGLLIDLFYWHVSLIFHVIMKRLIITKKLVVEIQNLLMNHEPRITNHDTLSQTLYTSRFYDNNCFEANWSELPRWCLYQGINSVSIFEKTWRISVTKRDWVWKTASALLRFFDNLTLIISYLNAFGIFSCLLKLKRPGITFWYTLSVFFSTEISHK